MKHPIVIACLLVLSLPPGLYAQDFDPPANPILTTPGDYARYEKDVIAAAKWLESNPIGADMQKRIGINSFVIKWISGSPTVSVELQEFQTKLCDKNPQLLALFMSAYARYCLENNYSKDVLKATTAAIKSVINCYSLGGDVRKNKQLEKAIRAGKEGKLEEWVKASLAAKT
jgi:hypothetical protein